MPPQPSRTTGPPRSPIRDGPFYFTGATGVDTPLEDPTEFSRKIADKGINAVPEQSDVVLYYRPWACSLAAHILLEERRLALGKADDAAVAGDPSYLQNRATGQVPVLATASGLLTENTAILPYLARLLPLEVAGLPHWPDHPDHQARCLEWLGWGASTLHVTYRHVRRPERYADTDAGRADVLRKGTADCRQLWSEVNGRLSERAWAVGERYTVADAYLLVFWNWGRSFLHYDMARDFPAWTRHATDLARRPAVARVYAREGIPLPGC